MKKLITTLTLLAFIVFAFGQKMEIGSSAYVTQSQGAYITVDGGLVTNTTGSFTLESNAAGTASLIITGSGSTTTSGDITVERFLEADLWHYISGQSNISGNFSTLSMGLGTPGSTSHAFYRWEEDYVYSSTTGIWVDILNGEDGTGSNTLMDDEGFVACKGYSISYATTDKTLSLSGVPYTSNQSITLQLTSGSTGEGANLVGNPFCSSIAINKPADASNNFIDQNIGVLATSYQAVYFWDESTSWNGTSDADYKAINNSSAATFAEPGQAFMVVAKTDGTTLNFNTSIQKHGAATFYKNQGDATPRIKLMVSDNAQHYNSTELVFLADMSTGLDPSYDAAKFKGNPVLSLYTRLVDDNGIDFAIQALPFADMENFVIPLGVDVASTDVFEFTAVQENMDHFNIMLEDREQNIVTNLRWESYFAEISNSGTGRFYLHFKDATAIGEINTTPIVTFRYVDGKILINNPEHQTGMVSLVNIQGQVLLDFRMNGEATTEIHVNQPTGVYILLVQTDKIKSGSRIFIY
jgi:hypothetical protein